MKKYLLVLVVQVLCAGTVLASPLDLSGVRANRPDFIDRTFEGERFDTLIDGTLTSVRPDRFRLRGYENGDLTTGGTGGSTVDYRLSFDRALDFAISGVASGDGSPAAVSSRRDMYTITADVDFLVNDPGNDDLRDVTIGDGFISFSFINRGPDTWTIRSVGAADEFLLSYTNLNTADRRNSGTVNVQVFAVPEPAAIALAGLGLLAAFGARAAHRARVRPARCG